jgi:hypothetical protein
MASDKAVDGKPTPQELQKEHADKVKKELGIETPKEEGSKPVDTTPVVAVKGKRTALQNVRTKELKDKKLLILIDLDPEHIAVEDNDNLGGWVWARTEGRSPIQAAGQSFKMRFYLTTPKVKGQKGPASNTPEDEAEWTEALAELASKKA